MKAWKIFLSVGVSVLVIGIIIFLVGLGLNGWKFETEYEKKTFIAENNNSALDLSISAGEIKVSFYGGETVTVEYPDSARYGYDVSEHNGCVTVAPRSSFGLWFGWRNIPAVNVYIPVDTVMDLKLDLSAGTATLPNGKFNDVELEMSAGTVNGGSISCRKFSGNLSAGSAHFGGLACDVTFRLDMSAGSATFDNLRADEIDVDLSAGTVGLTVVGAEKSDYTIHVDKSAGSCNLQNQQGLADWRKINVDLSAGTVNVGFGN